MAKITNPIMVAGVFPKPIPNTNVIAPTPISTIVNLFTC